MVSKKDIVDNITPLCGSAADARMIVDQIFDYISDGLSKGEKVRIHGFGSFQTVDRKARQAMNPKSGQTIDIPAKTVAKFTPSKTLRETVNA
jgi:nucleoid DNA-binding protein